MGLLGFGKISKAMAERLKPFGTKIVVYDPYVPVEIVDSIGIQQGDFESLIRKSDFISIHCPLTEETKNIIAEKELKKMKQNVYLINTSRAGIVDQNALFMALKEGWIAGAAVDVFDREPPEPNNPLLGLENLISSPHIGWYSENSRNEVAPKGTYEIVRMLKGGKPLNIVNKKAGLCT